MKRFINFTFVFFLFLIFPINVKADTPTNIPDVAQLWEQVTQFTGKWSSSYTNNTIYKDIESGLKSNTNGYSPYYLDYDVPYVVFLQSYPSGNYTYYHPWFFSALQIDVTQSRYATYNEVKTYCQDKGYTQYGGLISKNNTLYTLYVTLSDNSFVVGPVGRSVNPCYAFGNSDDGYFYYSNVSGYGENTYFNISNGFRFTGLYGGLIDDSSNSFEDSVFDDSLGKLNIKTSRYLNTSTHIYHDFFTIDTTTTTNVDVTQPGYGIKCQVLFYGDNDYLYDTEYFNLTDYRFNYDWKSKTFENLSLPSLPEPDKFSQYRIFLFPYKEENGTIKRGSFSSVSYGDYVSGVSTSNTREVGVHRVGVTRPDGSTKELDTFVKPLPVISGKGLILSDNDTINNKYVYEYHYSDEPDEITNNYISNNITNPDSIIDIPGNENVSDFDFGSIKAFLTGLYNFLFKLSKVLILWLGLPPFLATVLNLGLYVIVFLIFGSLFKKLF